MLDALSVAKQQAHAPVEKIFPGESVPASTCTFRCLAKLVSPRSVTLFLRSSVFQGFDVFNALDIMDNESFLKDCLLAKNSGMQFRALWAKVGDIDCPRRLDSHSRVFLSRGTHSNLPRSSKGIRAACCGQ